MSEHELEKLLGGFAADTLTAEERKLLYSAALQDQQLFNALADEQVLKELLADPAVRRRLLQSLNKPSTSGAGSSLSWLDWFRRPASLAFAGGLAVAAFAVLLGTKIYQDSLEQAVRSVATEESTPVSPPASVPSTSQPAPPQVAEPQPKAKDNAGSTKELAKKGMLVDKMDQRERPAPPPPKEQRASDVARDRLNQRSEQDEAPVAALSKAAEEVTDSTDQKLAASSPPRATTPAPAPMQAPASAPAAGAVTPTISARALFYKTVTEPAADQERRSQTATAEEKSGTGRMAEAPLREKKRAERGIGVLGKPESAKQSAGKPLGLRYSLIMAGPGGIDIEVDPTTPVGNDDAPRLAVQTNGDGYLSVLYARPSSDQPTVLFPSSGDGRVAGRRPIAIALGNVFDVQQTAEQMRLLIIFSRTPRDVNILRPTEKNLPHLLIEQVDPSQPGAQAEHAVYVVNPDPAPAAFLSIDVPLSLRP
ncbi:MAG: hypothetical protein EWM72_02872 [Nitrospira sp.]|nr:MAG: hypothetical protein EWM72_02872 [Nitrospira sp.]